MPSSPRTPRHSRHMSNDMGFSQLHYSPSSSPIERRGSRSSLAGDPATPLRGHGYPGRGDSMDMSMTGGLPGSGMNQSNGLGNLADELEGAFSDSGDEYYEEEDGETEEEHDGVAPGISVQDMGAGDETSRHRRGADGGTRDSGVDVASPVAAGGGADAAPGGRQKSMSLSLPSANGGRSRGGGQGHRRTPSEYDGSEYGSESDLDSPGMLTPSLVARMDAIESLARRGADSSPSDGVFQRVTEGLRDLGSQSNVEGGTTRYVFVVLSIGVYVSMSSAGLG